MTSFIPFEDTTGPAEDLEVFGYLRNGIQVLPDPEGDIPFHKQGQPIHTTYFNNATAESVVIATTNTDFNPLPFTRFVGTNTTQVNQPQFLSVNETIYME